MPINVGFQNDLDLTTPDTPLASGTTTPRQFLRRQSVSMKAGNDNLAVKVQTVLAKLNVEAFLDGEPLNADAEGKPKARNRIERCFNKLEHFRRFATRFDRRAVYFLSFIHLAGAMIWMR